MTGQHRDVGIGTMRRAVRLLVPVGVAALLAASCGSDDEPAAADDAAVEDTAAADDAAVADDAADTTEAGDLSDDVVEMAEDQVDALEEVQDAQGGGSARLVIGDDEWTFDSVLCAFGEEEIGQEGAEFVLSSIQDGVQVYVSIDSFGHSLDINDIENFEDPSVSLTAEGDDFVVLDGKSVSAAADFLDYGADDFSATATPGTFEATCP